MSQLDVLEELLDLGLGTTPDDLVPAICDVLARAGLHDARFYLVDYSQHSLMPLVAPGTEPLQVNSTSAGRAYRRMEPVEGGEGDHERWWLPLLNRGTRLGVLGVDVRDRNIFHSDLGDGLDSAATARLAELVTMLLLTTREFSDLTARASRAAPLDTATEMRWELLPALTLLSPWVSVAGVLEPAYSVAGDTFDYAVNGNFAQLAVFDPVGHGLEAAQIANLTIASYRNLRREHARLAETYRRIDEVLAGALSDEKYATAHLAELDLVNGQLSWIAAGHPPPLLLRNGRAHDLAGTVSTPMGMGLTKEPVVSTRSLEPGDFVLLFSDGVTEARSARGEEFGRELLAELLVRCAQSAEPLPEMVRRLVHAVLDHVDASLRDDATLLLLQWHPPRA